MQARHRGLCVGQRGDAVTDVAHGRHAQLGAELSGRAPVVGHGHHGRDVAADLLEPTQQGRQARTPADGHDAGPACQRALLVDELDQRLAARREGLQEHAEESPQADAEEGHADRDRQQGAHRIGQEVEADDAEELARQALRGHLAERGAKEQGAGRGQDGETDEHHQQPALDADAGSQPATQSRQASLAPWVRHRCFSSSRCQTMTGPRCISVSCAPRASLMATERWNPPVQPTAMVRRVLPSAR